MKDVYQGSFGSWKDVASEFADFYCWNDEDYGNALKVIPEPEEVIYANYGSGGYDGNALVVFRNGNNYYTVEGSHCSCYGLEGQWSPEEYVGKELFLEMIDRRIESSYSNDDYPSDCREAWQQVKESVLNEN